MTVKHEPQDDGAIIGNEFWLPLIRITADEDWRLDCRLSFSAELTISLWQSAARVDGTGEEATRVLLPEPHRIGKRITEAEQFLASGPPGEFVIATAMLITGGESGQINAEFSSRALEGVDNPVAAE